MQLPQPGEVIADKYRIEGVLGEGSFGCVYRGVADLSERPVAIKVLKPGRDGYDPKLARRFLRELRAIAKLQSPYTLTLYDYGRTDAGLLYMVTEYVAGDDLNELLAERATLSERETAHIVMQLLMSLEEAHASGILHRDIKPSNIRIFEYGGDQLRAKLLDFGLAQSLSADEARLTRTGNVIGTPRYMSPEQIRGQELGPTSDVYSLGLVALECLLGRVAGHFKASDGPPHINVQDPVSPAMRDVLNRMLAVDLDTRFPSASAAYDAFRAARADFDAVPDAATIRAVPTPDFEQPTVAQPKVFRPIIEVHEGKRDLAMPIVLAATFMVFVVAGYIVLGGAQKPAPVEPRQPNLRKLTPRKVTAKPPPDRRQCKHNIRKNDAGKTILIGRSSRLRVHASVPKGYQNNAAHPLVYIAHHPEDDSSEILRRFRGAAGGRAVAVAEPRPMDKMLRREQAIDWPQLARDLKFITNVMCVDEQQVFVVIPESGIASGICQLPPLAGLVFSGHLPYVPGTMKRQPLSVLGEDTVKEVPPVPACMGATPVLYFAGTDGKRAPYDGGRPCGARTTRVISVPEYERIWRETNDCSQESSVEQLGRHRCTSWNCRAPFVSCRVDGGNPWIRRDLALATPRASQACREQVSDFPYWDVTSRFVFKLADAK